MKKQVRAVVGATVVMPVAVALAVIGYLAWTSDLTFSGREFLSNPVVLLLLSFVLIGPVSLAVVVVLAFVTRYLAGRGNATFWRVTVVGAALGALTPIPLIVRILLDGELYQTARRDTLVMVLACTLIGVVSSAVYWLLLDPPSYYSTVQPDPAAADR